MSIDKAIYVAISGAAEAQREQAIHANNIANNNTAGFRKEYASQKALPVYNSGLPTRVYSATYTPGNDFSQGNIIETNNNLHIYLPGDGFFAVQGNNGVEGYTRRGDLQIDQYGQLINGNGYPMLNAGGSAVVLPPSKNVNISVNGEVFVTPLNATNDNMVLVDQLKLVNPDVKLLKQSNDTLFRLQDGTIAPNADNVGVRSGAYESSNVNTVDELMAMINSVRRLEMGLKVVSAVKDNAQSSSGLLGI
jgi:flagellar basal-body rod protein FlgF